VINDQLVHVAREGHDFSSAAQISCTRNFVIRVLSRFFITNWEH
jgi:hypothetical protein